MGDPVSDALSQLGWRYERKTNGFVKGDGWLSYEQAAAALTAAEEGRSLEPKQAVSRTVAAVLNGAGNEP